MIYEYECESCGHTCEYMQSIRDKPKKKCPVCNRMKLKRLISNTSFQLVGNGWYGSGGY